MKKIAKLGLNVLVLALAGLLALTGCSAKSVGELTQTILQAVTLPESYSIAYEVTDAEGSIRTVKKTVDAAGNVYFADGEQELLFLRQQDGTYLDAEGARHTAQAVDEATAAFADCGGYLSASCCRILGTLSLHSEATGCSWRNCPG